MNEFCPPSPDRRDALALRRALAVRVVLLMVVAGCQARPLGGVRDAGQASSDGEAGAPTTGGDTGAPTLGGDTSAPTTGGDTRGPVSGEDGPPPRARLVIGPLDGTTGGGGADIRFYLQDIFDTPVPDPFVSVIDDAMLNAVAAQAFVATWPERTPIAFTTELRTEYSAPHKIVHLVFAPTLEDRWYVAGVTRLPAGIAASTLADGTIGVRFRPGSHPRLAQVQFCQEPPPSPKLMLRFSESVVFTRPADELVSLQIGGASSPCQSYGASAASDVLFFTCAELTSTSKVVVTLGAGVQSAGGAAVAPSSWPIDLGALPAGNCREFALPL